MITVGVTATGGGIGQAVLRALAGGSLPVRTVAFDTRPLAPGLFWADAAHLVPYAREGDAYVARMLELCVREGVDVLVPGLDAEVDPLCAARDRFAEIGTRVIGGSAAAARLVRDKLALARYCRQRGLPFVATWPASEADRAGAWPLFAKPRWGDGSRGARRVAGPEDVARLPTNEDYVVQTCLRPDVGDDLVQAGEVSVQFLLAPDGTILGSFATVGNLKSGVPWEVRPVPDHPALAAGRPIAEALAAAGVRGPLNLQSIPSGDEIRFMEANARFTGLTAVRHDMGFREVEAALHAFVHDDDAAARACLQPDTSLRATRHVEHTIVVETRCPAEPAPSTGPVLLTGTTGYAGRVLAEALDATPVGGRLPGEVADLPAAASLVHAAAVREGDTGAMFAVNVEGTRRLAVAARAAGVGRFVYLSTQAVYGTARPAPWSEVLPPRPGTPYGVSKWNGEAILASLAGPEFRVIVLRLARLYGPAPAMRWSELPHVLCATAGAGRPIRLRSGGRARYDLLHVSDLVRAVRCALTAGLPGGPFLVVNVSGGPPVSVRDLAAECRDAARALGADAPEPVDGGEVAGGPVDHILDGRRAVSRLGFSPQKDRREAVAELVTLARDGRM
jgi:carbamoyl-phosphate synthase large subunit